MVKKSSLKGNVCGRVFEALALRAGEPSDREGTSANRSDMNRPWSRRSERMVRA